MQPFKYGKCIVLLVFMLAQVAFSVTYTVSKNGSSNFTTIQDAVDEAGIGDVILIEDTETYKEQVTIDSLRSGLTLTSNVPQNSLTKPTIVYKDETNVGPRNATEAKDESKITFDQNGALRVMRASGVRIENIAVDGGGAFPFGGQGAWGTASMQHGNAAITVWVAGECIIRNCDIKNAYIGINVKDRNEGGVFANPNPADLDPENIIPFSGFAKTGNHLFEYNRIHNNSVGIYVESAWDMGSTIRYNLIYENHHQTRAIAQEVFGTTTDDMRNHSGGAFMFKDILLSPLAIYNNTLWHNKTPFQGHWKAGGQHLIFNNIIGEPNDYDTLKYSGEYEQGLQFNISEMSKVFENRMHNCTYAAQSEKPTQYSVQICNGLQMSQPSGPNNTFIGGELISPFPASAEIRWLEIKFLSTDPTSADFLVPDWNDPDVQQYIENKGWEESGVMDFDGSRADLGAFSSAGGRQNDIVTIRPGTPIELTGDSAKINFVIDARQGTMTDLVVKMFGAVTQLDTANTFGSDDKVKIPASNIQRVSLGTQPVVLGSNTINVDIPATGDFAFLEMIVEGTGSSGKKFTSAVGFMPYRELEFTIDVEVLGSQNGTPIDTVRAGQQVYLRVSAFNRGQPFNNAIDEANTHINLQTPTLELLDHSGAVVSTVAGGLAGTATVPVMFTRVPPNGAKEYVTVTARWIDQDKVVAFLGGSNGITVLAGPADSVAFQTPSKFGAVVEMNTGYLVMVQAFDMYGNEVDQPTIINCESLEPAIGDFSVKTDTTDNTGLGMFYAYPTDGSPKDTFHIRASLGLKPDKTADAFLIVGEPTDKIYIFYGDTAGYDITDTIEACASERVPVTIRAGKDSASIATDQNSTVNLSHDPGFAFYATAISTDPISQAQLVSGEVVVYIQANSPLVGVTNEMIIVTPEDPTITGANRSGVNFKVCQQVRFGAYYANNGNGAVDRAEVWYTEPLSANQVPDSIRFCWPSTGSVCKTVYKIGGGISLDPADASHLVVSFPSPFAEAKTIAEGAATNLATAYLTGAVSIPMNDSVGPLLASAMLVERLTAGDDSMIITFTEPVDYTKLSGQTLTLIQGGQPLQLTIKSARPGDNQQIVVTVDNTLSAARPVAGDSLKITVPGTVSDNNGNFPHPQNRPVVILLKAVAPSLLSAAYRDGNGDGIVDTVRLTFNKPADTAAVLFTVNFDGTPGLQGAASDAMTYVGGSGSVIDMRIDQLFTDAFLRDKTSGPMQVTTQFMKFPDGENISSATAIDSAAPVVTAVEYHFGRMDSVAYDTLFIEYSEQLTGVPTDLAPLNFKDATGATYTVPVFIPTTATDSKYPKLAFGAMDGFYQFVVDSLTLGERIVTGNDSAKINTANPLLNAIDMNGNAQTVETNKMVPVVVKIPPFLSIEYGPNPITSLGEQFKVRVQAMTKVTGSVKYDYSFQIIDKVGNPVDRIPESGMNHSVNSFFEIPWDGRNRAGRFVGNGTYIGILNVSYSSVDGATYTHKQNIKIGIKR